MPEIAAYPYDLFISHAAADRAWVEGYLAEALRQAGLRWHAEATFPADRPRLPELERAIQESRRVALILSPAYLAEGFSNVVGLLARHYGPGDTVWPVSPILLEPVTLPARLPMLPTLDASDPRKWPRVINRLCSELGHPLRGPVHKPPCPYPGLRAFDATDVPRFYGRDADIGLLLGQLRHGRIVLVTGPSGAGKTSLVQAGLLPQLPASLHWPPGFWLTRTLRPGAHPLRALATVLDATHGGPRDALNDLLDAHTPAGRLLLVVDPLEEVFALAEPAEQEAFITALQELRADARCALVLVIRDDFYPDLMTSALWPIGVHQRVEVAPLRGAALRQAILQPALQAGVQVEADLLARLLADAAPEPDPLPLVQETLVGLWSALEQRLLTLRPYQQVTRGPHGLPTAFAARVDTAFRALAGDQQAVVARLLLRLVQPGMGRADTRRPQTVGDLSALEDDPASVGPLLHYLAANGLLTLDGPETEPDTTVDLAHETLLLRWPRLRGWLRTRHAAPYARRAAGPPTHAWVRRPAADETPLPPAPTPVTPSRATSSDVPPAPEAVEPVPVPLVETPDPAPPSELAPLFMQPGTNGQTAAPPAEEEAPRIALPIEPVVERNPLLSSTYAVEHSETPVLHAANGSSTTTPHLVPADTDPPVLAPVAAVVSPLDPPTPRRPLSILGGWDTHTIRPVEHLSDLGSDAPGLNGTAHPQRVAVLERPTAPPVPEVTLPEMGTEEAQPEDRPTPMTLALLWANSTSPPPPAPRLEEGHVHMTRELLWADSAPREVHDPLAEATTSTAPSPPAEAGTEEPEEIREQAIQAARARLAHLAILRVEDDRRQAAREMQMQLLHRVGGTGVLIALALALLIGMVWLLGWGGW